VICSENSYVDQAKSVLIKVLEELDAKRNHIYGEFEPSNGIHAIVNANELFLTTYYLKRKLQVDARQIKEA